MVEKINTTNDQNAETNVDWLDTGERMTKENLNRPVKQVADKVNELIDYVDDSKVDLQSQIDERVSVDMSLSDSIDAEAAARINADDSLSSRIQVIENNPYNHPSTHPASMITTVDEFNFSNSGNVQDVLEDLDRAIDHNRIYNYHGRSAVTNRAEVTSVNWTNNTFFISSLPSGYHWTNIIAFIPTITDIHYNGDVNSDDSTYLYWRLESTNYPLALNQWTGLRVSCHNSENRAPAMVEWRILMSKGYYNPAIPAIPGPGTIVNFI
jgi:hypothetical protein